MKINIVLKYINVRQCFPIKVVHWSKGWPHLLWRLLCGSQRKANIRFWNQSNFDSVFYWHWIDCY